MKFIKRLFSFKQDPAITELEWVDKMVLMAQTLVDDKIAYPVIMFCHVAGDFQIYYSATNLISESIVGHWGTYNMTEDELELVVDSKGNSYKISHNHSFKNQQNVFSYPSIYMGTETLTDLKDRIMNECDAYQQHTEEERIERDRIFKTLKTLGSFSDLIIFTDNYLKNKF